jgi:DNA-binding CsgD family transcriptional regulator
MSFEIVGREEDRATVEAFVGRDGRGASALVLEGEAGIGKSTLWLAGVQVARSRGLRVLLSRPAEAERGLAHAGLGDLLEDALPDVAPLISTPMRRALEIALLREEATDDPVDHRALCVATRDVLHLLSEREPILLAVDDVQWLDPSSSSALAFALRRLAASPVLVLVSRRLVAGAEPSGLEQALEAGRVERLPVGPLSVGALHRLLHDRFGRSFARQTLLRIYERSGGNPLFALELARVLDVDVDPLEPLPVPERLDELVRARLAALPTATRDALALASALGTPSEWLMERAGVAADALEPAIAAQVIERENGTIRFTHPLLSSAVYPESGAERRSVHGRIARIVDDPVLRARHLAMSTDAPDAGVAGALDEAARLAADGGAPATAAELAEQAVRLTPPDRHDERDGRALAAARAHHSAGEWTRARSIASDLLAETGIGSLRAEALVLLAELESGDRSVALLEDALAEASTPAGLRSTMHSRLAWPTCFVSGCVPALDHARVALALADADDDDAGRIVALTVLAAIGVLSGDAAAPAHAARAHELAAAAGDAKLLEDAVFAVAAVRISCRSNDAARHLLQREYDDWRERDEPRSARALWSLAWVEIWAGRWERAADHAIRSRDLKLQYGIERPEDLLPAALVAVHRGELGTARAYTERMVELSEAHLGGEQPPPPLATHGLLLLWSGDASAGAAWLGKADRRASELGWGEPCNRWWSADYAEALLELGRIEDAVRVIDLWEADATRLGRDWVLAHVARCRGLVAAARGEIERAASLLEHAAAAHEAVGDPFGHARALLALGVVRRRERQKRDARDAIAAALSEFERLGAATWIETARAELGRIGGRTRIEGLTPAERRVALLVAEGRTNREVAAALSLGQRTVETHLTHVYAKLGVRSRAELARTYRPDEQSSGGSAISS